MEKSHTNEKNIKYVGNKITSVSHKYTSENIKSRNLFELIILHFQVGCVIGLVVCMI